MEPPFRLGLVLFSFHLRRDGSHKSSKNTALGSSHHIFVACLLPGKLFSKNKILPSAGKPVPLYQKHYTSTSSTQFHFPLQRNVMPFLSTFVHTHIPFPSLCLSFLLSVQFTPENMTSIATTFRDRDVGDDDNHVTAKHSKSLFTSYSRF